MLIKKTRSLSVPFFLAFSLLITIPNGRAIAAPEDKGIGPVQSVTLGALDETLASKGKALFTAKCSACHKMPEKYVGPALGEVVKRRSPEWIMNMILNPTEMLEKNDTAKELLGEFLVPMTYQNVSQDEARAILEYFRYYSEKGELGGAEGKGNSKPSKKKKG